MKKVVKNKKSSEKKPSSKKPTIAQMIARSKRKIDDARQMAIKEGEKLFKSAVKELFKNHKGLHKIQWNQYTPNWNDGDACLFSTYFDSMKVNDEEDPEDIHWLGHIKEILSNKEKSEAKIVMELSATKDKWEAERLKRDLEIVRTRRLEEISEMYEMKKAVMELLPEIDDSVYESMFGEGTVVVTRDGITVEHCEHD